MVFGNYYGIFGAPTIRWLLLRICISTSEKGLIARSNNSIVYSVVLTYIIILPVPVRQKRKTPYDLHTTHGENSPLIGHFLPSKDSGHSNGHYLIPYHENQPLCDSLFSQREDAKDRRTKQNELVVT